MTTPENQSNAETKRSFGLLAAAIVFFGAILWWKSDQIFGDPQPTDPNKGGKQAKQDPTDKGGKQAKQDPADKGKEQDKPAPFQPVRNTDANAATIPVTVKAKDGGKPLADARVLALTRKGAVLAHEKTDASGKATLRPNTGEVRGFAVWHEDHMVDAVITDKGPIEFELPPVQHVFVDCGEVTPARKAWFDLPDVGLTVRYDRKEANAMAAREPFLRMKILEHLGIRSKKWRVTGNVTKIPRYLDIKGIIRLESDVETPTHLDHSGMMGGVNVRKNEADTSELAVMYTGKPDARLHAPPKRLHGVILEYERKAADEGVLMLHLKHLNRDLTSTDFSSPTTCKSNFSTYVEKDGVATFMVCDLGKTIYYPTIIVYPKGGERRFVRCNPIEVDGLTKAKLVPIQYAKLTVRTDQPAEVTLLDDRLEPAINVHGGGVNEKKAHWDRVEPTTIRFVARSATHTSQLVQRKVKPGEHLEVDLKLVPKCVVTLEFKHMDAPERILVRSKATGTVREYYRDLYERIFYLKFEGKDDKDRIARLTGSRGALQLPAGEFEFERINQDGSRKKFDITIKDAKQTVRLL